MKKIVTLVGQLFFGASVCMGQTWAPQPWPNAAYIEGVIRSENEGLRTNDQASVPARATDIADRSAKDLAAVLVANAIMCREWKKNKSSGTGPSLPLPTDAERQNPDVAHSADIAHVATAAVIDGWANMTEEEKEAYCNGLGQSFFWHQCYEKSGNTYLPLTGTPYWPNPRWVRQLRDNPASYECIPTRGKFFLDSGGRYCRICSPTVPVK